MLNYQINRLQDAYKLIQRYQLHRMDWGAGTVEGFAAWLLIHMSEVQAVQCLSSACTTYRAELEECVLGGGNLDQELLSKAAAVEEQHLEQEKRRAELAEFVRTVKFAPRGFEVWQAIAMAATVPSDRRRRVAPADPWVRGAMADVLSQFGRFKETHEASAGLEYAPGEDLKMDSMIRMDLERMDQVVLGAPAWNPADGDWFFEVAAVLELLRDKNYRKFLRTTNRGPDSEPKRHLSIVV